MYNIKCDKKYKLKLDVPDFYSRFNGIKSNKKIIIYIKDEFEVTSFRYRAYNIMESLKNSKKYYVTCFLVEELRAISKVIDKIDLIVLQRCKWSIDLVSFLNFAKFKGKKIVYDIDDLIYDNKYIPNYLANIGDYTDLSTSSLISISSSYNLVTDYCDEFIASVPILADYMRKDFNKKVHCYHNFLNYEQEDISKIIRELKKRKRDDSKFVIGYFSGSGTHVRDLNIALDDILKIMEKYDNVYFLIVGYMALNDSFTKYIKNKRLVMKSFVPYQELQYLIGSVDLNIVPLQNNKFNNCKSELKYFEASIVDTITIASNNMVYGKVIEDGVDGFLAEDYEWYDKIEYVYLNEKKLSNLVINARNKAIDNYSCGNQSKNLEKLYDQIIGGRKK